MTVQPLVRAAWGGALLFAPRQALRLLGAPATPAGAVVTARVLGVRHVAQALVSREWPTRNVFAAGAVTDGLHAATGVLLAAAAPHWRRTGLSDATLAMAFALTSGAASARARRPRRRTILPSIRR
jgi:hypothetical protein